MARIPSNEINRPTNKPRSKHGLPFSWLYKKGKAYLGFRLGIIIGSSETFEIQASIYIIKSYTPISL